MTDNRPYRVRTRPEPRPAAIIPPQEDIPVGGEAASPEVSDDPAPSKRPYKVGKGCPPEEHQFVKGVCPNRFGRGGGNKNLRTYAKEEFNKKLKVREGSRVVSKTKGQIGMTRMINRWVEHGDPKTYDKIVEIMGDEAVRGVVAPAFEKVEVRQETNEAVLKWYRDTILSEGARHD